MLWQRNADPHDIVEQFQISLRTVQRLFARFEERGDDGIEPDYKNCGTHQAVVTVLEAVEDICQTCREHPRWGADMIRLELEEGYDDVPVPERCVGTCVKPD